MGTSFLVRGAEYNSLSTPASPIPSTEQGALLQASLGVEPKASAGECTTCGMLNVFTLPTIYVAFGGSRTLGA